MFAVIRHLETGGVGTSSADAMDIHRAKGWIRVSEYRAAPGDFHLPDFAEASEDLDAPPAEPDPEPQPDEKPAKTTKESKA